MLPSLEALSPGLALTLVMCSVEYKDMQYVFNESYPPKVMARRLFARPPTRPIRLGVCLLVAPS